MSTDCHIEAVSWGYDDSGPPLAGEIAVNGDRVFGATSVDFRGFNTIELNVTTCSTSNPRRFDTWRSMTASENMATYVNSLPVATVLIGVTSDEASSNLTPNAITALNTIGVDISGLLHRGKASFVAQTGQPTMSWSLVAPRYGDILRLKVVARGSK
jgi:Interleukin-like EMT inducer